MKGSSHAFAALVLAALFQQATAAEIDGVTIPDSVTLPGTTTQLQLNGAGIRSKFLFDIYIGALYLPARSHDVAGILADDTATGVLMHFLYKEVSREKITDGWNEGLQANLPASEYQALLPRLEQFNRLFTTVRKGDRISIDYLPGSGTEVRINDEWRGKVEGNDFFRALLKVWLGPEPVSKDLRSAMLGGD
jgi:hypothetical protein